MRKAIIDELNKQRGAYTTPQEDTANWKFIEEEKNREDEVYRENVDKARQSFIRAKNMRDDLAAQVRSLSTDSDDTLQQIKTIRTTIENIDNSLIRWNQDTEDSPEILRNMAGCGETGFSPCCRDVHCECKGHTKCP